MEDIVKMHILYVEDDAPSGLLLQSIAQAAGYNAGSLVAAEKSVRRVRPDQCS